MSGVEIRGRAVELRFTGLRITIISGNLRLREEEFGNEMSGKFQTSGLLAWTQSLGFWIMF